jgi:CubicO group peptidase (beta-lactamase class C family)
MRRRYRIFKPEGSLVFPSATWEEYSGISESGFTPAGVTSVLMMLRDLPTTSLMVVAGGKIAFKYGDVTEVSYLASARKSILSMLFGHCVESGAIDLEGTIGDLGIDDVGGLLPVERSATIADLLTTRSGVYHPAANPGSDENAQFWPDRFVQGSTARVRLFVVASRGSFEH